MTPRALLRAVALQIECIEGPTCRQVGCRSGERAAALRALADRMDDADNHKCDEGYYCSARALLARLDAPL